MVLVRFKYLRSVNSTWLRRNVYLLNIGAKSFRDGSQDICKDTESTLAPFAGFLRLKLSRSKPTSFPGWLDERPWERGWKQALF